MHSSVSVLLVVLIVTLTLIFDFINGFHDTANAIATVVSTRVLTPRTAILMAASLNFLGALCFTQVAQAIASAYVLNSSQPMILAAILAAITWNLITWYFGIPSSSSHALIGGLLGAAFVQGGLHDIKWDGVLHKALIPLIASPIGGFVLGYVIMSSLFQLFAKAHPKKVSGIFRSLQVVSAAIMSFSHGTNDAQKSMGIITLALVSLSHQPVNKAPIPLWVKIVCAVAMALGTSSGGWRIMKTMGHRIIRLEPVHGFAAETSASLVILYATLTGAAVSTTHVISGSIFGVGAAKRLSAVRWTVAQSMITAWILTIPAAALVAGLTFFLLHALGMK